MLRYDVGRLSTSLADLRVPVMALQTTYSNERRARRLMSEGQTTPYLEMLRARIPSVRIGIIKTAFPQVDESAQTNALLDGFLATLHASWRKSASPGRERPISGGVGSGVLAEVEVMPDVTTAHTVCAACPCLQACRLRANPSDEGERACPRPQTAS